VAVKLVPDDPAVAVAGKTVARVGTGSDAGAIENAKSLEAAPALETSICSASFEGSGEAVSEAGTTAVSCVEVTNVVAKAETTLGAGSGGTTTQSTTELLVKFAPVTVIVTGEVPQDGVEAAIVVDAETAEMLGGEIVNATCADVPPLTPAVGGLIRTTFAV
jgi:peroxiredoxin